MYELFILLILVIIACSCIVCHLLIKSIIYIRNKFKELNKIKDDLIN